MSKICQKATLYESRETVHKMDGKDFKRYSWFVEHSDADHDKSDQEDAPNSQRVEEVNPRIGLKQTEERERSPQPSTSKETAEHQDAIEEEDIVRQQQEEEILSSYEDDDIKEEEIISTDESTSGGSLDNEASSYDSSMQWEEDDSDEVEQVRIVQAALENCKLSDIGTVYVDVQHHPVVFRGDNDKLNAMISNQIKSEEPTGSFSSAATFSDNSDSS